MAIMREHDMKAIQDTLSNRRNILRRIYETNIKSTLPAAIGRLPVTHPLHMARFHDLAVLEHLERDTNGNGGSGRRARRVGILRALYSAVHPSIEACMDEAQFIEAVSRPLASGGVVTRFHAQTFAVLQYRDDEGRVQRFEVTEAARVNGLHGVLALAEVTSDATSRCVVVSGTDGDIIAAVHRVTCQCNADTWPRFHLSEVMPGGWCCTRYDTIDRGRTFFHETAASAFREAIKT